MILTTCPACAAPLAHDAPRCVRCKTRYCNKLASMTTGAAATPDFVNVFTAVATKQYHADKKYGSRRRGVGGAGRHKGPDVLHLHAGPPLKTKEGLRGCACRGTAGFAHVSCLAEQAKILRQEAEDNNLGVEAKQARFDRWHTCSLCEQEYHGVVQCALGGREDDGSAGDKWTWRRL